MKLRKPEPLKFAGMVGGALLVLAGALPAPPAGGAAPVAPAAPAPGKGGAPAEKSGAPAGIPTETAQGLGSFGKMLPLGEKNHRVRIPSFREGVPSSFVRAATMTRLDDERMDMEDLDIRMYGATRDKDLRIMMPAATYHMSTEVLSGNQRSRIDRDDFRLEGDTLVFDTRTQQGKMTGNIHMIIHDADSLKQQPAKPSGDGGQAKAQVETKRKEPGEKK